MDRLTAYNPEYVPPTLESQIEQMYKWPAAGLNLEVFAEGLNSGKIPIPEQQKLSEAFVTGYNRAFRHCHPGDALHNLKGQNLVSKNIPPREDLDLDNEWEEITKLLKMDFPWHKITAEFAFKHFKKFSREDFPDYPQICDRISTYISECLRRAHVNGDRQVFARIIPAFRLLGYFHKLQEGQHYWCQDEFDCMAKFGIDPEKLEFRDLPREEVEENFFKDMDSTRS